jgi:hypothetical protein
MVTTTMVDNGLLTPHAAIVMSEGYVEVVVESEDYAHYKNDEHMTDEELFAFALGME